jgi:ribose 5-phosphate isomerase B
MKIAIGADHGGYLLKDALREYLTNVGHEVEDVGTNGPESVDYPAFARAVGQLVASGSAERGILVCGTGIGISIAANKVRGVRAALVSSVTTARLAAEHNNANVLCLGGRLLASELASEIVQTWLDTAFETRHQRRLDMIAALERNGEK